MRGVCRIVVLALLLAGCTRNPGEPARDEQAGSVAQAHEGIVTISGDDTILESLTWRPPAVEIPPDGIDDAIERAGQALERSEEHTSELQSLMRISYAVFCLKYKKTQSKI